MLSRSSSRSSVSSRIPENPFARTLAQRQHRADHGDRKRIADAGGVAAQQVQLEGGEVFGRDAGLGKAPEPGVDPVGRRIALREGLDHRARGTHAFTHGVG